MSPIQGIDEIIDGLDKLPTLPGIAVKILEAVQSEETSLQELAEILSTDPPLSAEVLRLINSPYYGLNSKVTTVQHAVNMLGGTVVKNLALSFSLVKNFQQFNDGDFDYAQFWKDSLYCAVTTKLIASKVFPALTEDAFFLGLLHDIGILALNQSMPKQYQMVLTEKNINQSTYPAAEMQVLGFTHMEIGSQLADRWCLPEIFIKPIQFHHCPEKLGEEKTEIDLLTKILHLTSLIADFINLSDKPFTLSLIEHYADAYGLGDKFQLESILEESEEKTATVFPVFDIKIDSEQSYMEMIETARKELIHLSSDFMNRLAEQKKQIEVLSNEASHDGLTNLINYRRFQESMDEEMYRARRYKFPLTLIMADIDYFKKINDTFGHQAGNYVLRTFADFLIDSLRKSDVIARYGGEEFAMLLPETPLDGAFMLAERLRMNISSLKINYGEHQIQLTASFGVASFTPDSSDSNADLIKKADAALYRAKESGRNKCCMFTDEN